jgi:hypothetical protein
MMHTRHPISASAHHLLVCGLFLWLFTALAAVRADSALSQQGLKVELQLQRVDRRVQELAGAEAQKALRVLAESVVLADFCAGLELNESRLKQDLDHLAKGPGTDPHLDPRQYENRIRTHFGVYVGLLIAESVDRGHEFCRVGLEDLKRQGPMSRWWLKPIESR